MRPARAGSTFAGSEVMRKRTQIEGLLWSLYSTSASARAVRSCDAPVNRLQALVDVAAVQEIDERPGDHRFVLRAHRQVGVVPLSEHAQPFEILPLQVDVLLGVLAAGAPDLDRRHLRLARAQLAIDLDFDGQPVAIPARNVGRIEARHGLRFDHEVLQNLVERGAQMNPPVGIGRPVVEDVHGASGAGGPNPAIEILLLPPLERLRLGLRKVGLHRKAGLRQIDGLLQVDGFGIHLFGVNSMVAGKAG